MAATYKFKGWEKRNPVKHALYCAIAHSLMLHEMLKRESEELANLNLELIDLLDRAKDYYEKQEHRDTCPEHSS